MTDDVNGALTDIDNLDKSEGDGLTPLFLGLAEYQTMTNKYGNAEANRVCIVMSDGEMTKDAEDTGTKDSAGFPADFWYKSGYLDSLTYAKQIKDAGHNLLGIYVNDAVSGAGSTETQRATRKS